MYKKQAGFTLVEVLLIVLVVAVIGFGAYYVGSHQHKAGVTNLSATTAGSKTANAAAPHTKTVPTPTLAEATDLTQKVYSAWNQTVMHGQVLQDQSQWAQNNVNAAQDLQFINANKSWFTTPFVSKANNYETTNTSPPGGGGFFICFAGSAYYNGNAKAVGNQLIGQTANVTVSYTSGNAGSGGIKSHSIPVALQVTNGSWAINGIDLSSCAN